MKLQILSISLCQLYCCHIDKIPLILKNEVQTILILGWSKTHHIRICVILHIPHEVRAIAIPNRPNVLDGATTAYVVDDASIFGAQAFLRNISRILLSWDRATGSFKIVSEGVCCLTDLRV